MSVEGDPFEALGSSVARLLRGEGESALADLVETARFEPTPVDEAWEIDGRQVVAKRIAMLVSPERFAGLRRSDADFDRVREAVRAVVRSLSTELSELLLLVDRVPFEGVRGASYRSPSPRERSEATPREVRALSEALAAAFDESDLSGLLSRAEFEVASLGETDLPLRRWVVRLPVADLVRVDRDLSLRASLERIVRIAATSAAVRVAEVDVAPLAP